MSKLQALIEFISRIVLDKRLSPTHFSLFTAIFHVWIENGFADSYKISRKQIMRLSHIHSIATYHKIIKDLQSFNYIHYTPSYHPSKASLVRLLFPDRSSIVISNDRINT